MCKGVELRNRKVYFFAHDVFSYLHFSNLLNWEDARFPIVESIFDSIVKKSQQRLYFLCQAEVKSATGAAESVLLYHHWVCPVFIYNCLVWLSYQIRYQDTTTNSQDCWEDYWCSAAEPFESFTLPEWENGQKKSPWTPHIQHTPALNCCPLSGATEHWAPKQPDTRTVLFSQAISHLKNT